jgi:glucokinase
MRSAQVASGLADHDDLTTEHIGQAAEANDPVAIATVRCTAVYLGRAIAMLSHIADPEVVLLGGAVNFGGQATRTGQDFLRTIREEMQRLSLVQTGSTTTIDFATLGNDAGMLGAAHHARLLTASEEAAAAVGRAIAPKARTAPGTRSTPGPRGTPGTRSAPEVRSPGP